MVNTRIVAKERGGIKGVRYVYITHCKEDQGRCMSHISDIPTQPGARCWEHTAEARSLLLLVHTALYMSQ